MSQLLTTYIAKGKKIAFTWIFKYTLNGNLTSWEIQDSAISEKQYAWLCGGNLPYKEAMMKSAHWGNLVTVEKIEAPITFDTFYDLYKYKIKPKAARAAWAKLSHVNQIKAIQGINAYMKYLKRTRTGQAHPSTYLNGEYFDSDWNSAQ